MTERIERAFALANQLHSNQRRKTPIVPGQPGAPYISHCMEVAAMVWAVGGDENVVIAALLHDLLEDTPITVETIDALFDRVVVGLVLECTEVGTSNRDGVPKPHWRERKDAYIAHMAEISEGGATGQRC